MFKFEGEITGGARDYLIKKHAVLYFLISLILFIVLDVVLSFIPFGYFFLPVLLVLCIVFYAVLRAMVRSEFPRTIEINDYEFIIRYKDRDMSIPIFRLIKIIDFSDFYAFEFEQKIPLAVPKDILVQGSMEEFENFFKGKIVQEGEEPAADLETNSADEQPFIPPTAPQGEFVSARVISKRIAHTYDRSRGIYMKESEYYGIITFLLGDGKEVEYAVPPELYERCEENQVGTLVTVNGKFFDFGQGEEIEE